MGAQSIQTGAGAVVGKVKDASPMAAETVVLVIPEEQQRAYPSRVYECTPDPNGAFSFASIPQGKYAVFAVAKPARSVLEVPFRMLTVDSHLDPIMVAPNATVTVQAPVLQP